MNRFLLSTLSFIITSGCARSPGGGSSSPGQVLQAMRADTNWVRHLTRSRRPPWDSVHDASTRSPTPSHTKGAPGSSTRTGEASWRSLRTISSKTTPSRRSSPSTGHAPFPPTPSSSSPSMRVSRACHEEESRTPGEDCEGARQKRACLSGTIIASRHIRLYPGCVHTASRQSFHHQTVDAVTSPHPSCRLA